MKQLTVLLIALAFIATTVNAHSEEECGKNYCSVNISVSTEKEHYNNSEKITFYNTLSGDNNEFNIEYWIEDDYGSIIKNMANTTNTNKKSFTPNLDYPTNIHIKNKLLYLSCNNTNTVRESEKVIPIYMDKSFDMNISLVSIKNLKRNNYHYFNDTLKINFLAYTGNNSNLTVSASLSNLVGNNTNLAYRYKQYQGYILLTIPYDCSIKTDNYTIRLSAIDIADIENITITNKCIMGPPLNESVSNKYNSNTTNNPDNISESVINSFEPATGSFIYEGSSKKATSIASLIFIIVMFSGGFLLFKNKKSEVITNGFYGKGNN